jgi:hypothetical protein
MNGMDATCRSCTEHRNSSPRLRQRQSSPRIRDRAACLPCAMALSEPWLAREAALPSNEQFAIPSWRARSARGSPLLSRVALVGGRPVALAAAVASGSVAAEQLQTGAVVTDEGEIRGRAAGNSVAWDGTVFRPAHAAAKGRQRGPRVRLVATVGGDLRETATRGGNVTRR